MWDYGMRISYWSSDVLSSDLFDEAAVQRHGAFAFVLGRANGRQDALGLVDLGLGGAVDLVGELDLARVDRPLALAAEHRGAARLGLEALRVGEVAEGAVDRPQARGARRHHHAGDGVVPHVPPVVVALTLVVVIGQHAVHLVGAADDRGARLGRSGVVGDAEVQALVARRGRGDGVPVGHAQGRPDDHLDTYALLSAAFPLGLRPQTVDAVAYVHRTGSMSHE